MAQSDKASVEITSRFTGVIKKLHYDSDDMAIVGKPLVDIDIQGEISLEDEALINPGAVAQNDPVDNIPAAAAETDLKDVTTPAPSESSTLDVQKSRGKHSTLATPAVRHLTKELGIDIADIDGTGKDGRVLKEDVQRHVAVRDSPSSTRAASSSTTTITEDTPASLTPAQAAMFRTMTKSLAIPHFLYSDAIDTTTLTALRRRLNSQARGDDQRISALAFILKAMSQALVEYPILNARLDTTSESDRPTLVYRPAHNIGIAVDTPSGLIVPVVRNVQALSVLELAKEISRLASLGKQGKLTSADFTGGTFSVSNVGSIGGGVVSPVIVEGQMSIVGVGKAKRVPAFDEHGEVVAREECTLSWSADHRVVDGATVARCAELVRGMLEEPSSMLVNLR
ncbi:hypothetical protein FH972_023469 [Carpinus fangiana]|uniref:Dihydrolipoamide acetyltransferase component of pyruvate dehydrogenase complex n=1 Tax=Carpinus fangiana TaxID=176857 RepID=A0A5N6KVN6_9ROSI|nr:hypothetical protein FH972_023469 [Carpinus fangiana]